MTRHQCAEILSPWLTWSVLWMNCAVCGFYVVMFAIQVRVLSSFDFHPNVSWLFLPHGVRLLAILIGRALVIPGLFLGALLTIWVINESIELGADVVSALFSASMVFLALKLTEALVPRPVNERLTMGWLLLLLLMSALTNSAGHTLMFWALDRLSPEGMLASLKAMTIGDLAGGLMCLVLVWIGLKLARLWLAPEPGQQAKKPFGVASLELAGAIAGAVFISYQALALLDWLLLSPLLSLGLGPFTVLIMASWGRIGGAMLGWVLGGLAIAPDFTIDPMWMCVFSVAGALILLATRVMAWRLCGAIPSLDPRIAHAAVAILLFGWVYGSLFAFIDGTSPMETVLMLWLCGAVLWLCVLAPLSWLARRVLPSPPPPSRAVLGLRQRLKIGN